MLFAQNILTRKFILYATFFLILFISGRMFFRAVLKISNSEYSILYEVEKFLNSFAVSFAIHSLKF